MSRTITGLTNVPQGKTSGHSSQRGYYERYVEDFTDEAAAQAAGWAFGPTYEWEVSPIGGGCYRLTATKETAASGGSIPDPNLALNDVWELNPNAIEKDFLEADLSAINAFSADEIKDIRRAGDDTTVDITSYSANQIKCVKLIRAGVKSIRVFQPVLRHTMTFARNTTVLWSQTNSGSVLSTAALQSSEGVPNTLLFSLQSNSNPTRTDGLVLKYGWFKKPPTVTQVGGGRWQIVQEWEYGLWSNELYAYIA